MRKSFALLISVLCLSLNACASVSVEMPANVGYLQDFDISISIDKDIQDKANVFTYLDPCSMLAWTKGEMQKDSFFTDPQFNYKGEARIDLSAVYTSPGKEKKDCELTFRFYYMENLGTDRGSYGGQTTNIWKDGKATVYAQEKLAEVKNVVRVHPTEIVISLPAGYMWQKSDNHYPFTGSAYAQHKDSSCQGNDCYSYSLYYGIRPKGFFGKEEYDGTKTFREVFDANMDSRGDTWRVATESVDQSVLSALGAKEGYMRKLSDVKSWSTFDPIDLEAEFLINKNNYYIYFTIDLSRNYPAEKGQENLDDQLAAAKRALSSISFSPHMEQNLTPQQPKKDEPQKKTIKVEGKISDFDNKGLPYMEVEIATEEGKIKTYTDKDGKYSASVIDVVFPIGKNEVPANITAKLSYVRDGKNYYIVAVGTTLVEYQKKIKLKNSSDSVEDIKMDGHASPGESVNIGNMAFMQPIGVVYRNLHEVTDFALTQLKANIDYKLPVEVYLARWDDGTYYIRDDSVININSSDTSYGSKNKPDNREYHEFCHHIMFSEWGGKGLRGPGDKNHGGYANNDSGDSYTEGFAEFCAMACSKYWGDPKPDIYAGFGSMELNYKAFNWRGFAEELAVNGILWDMYDDHNDRGDTISLPLDKMWEVMKVRRSNFYEYYKAFKAAFPDKGDAIDKIFIEHGFFADKNPGNKQYDNGEAYRDLNDNKRYDAGEPYIDYGVVEGLARPWMQYDAGETIGQATNYERPNRGCIVELEGSYVKAHDPSISRYKVSVDITNPEDGESFEYYTNAVNGLVYIAPLPEDLDAKIEVVADPDRYTTGKPYSIKNSEYVKKFDDETEGFFDSHNFEAKKTKQTDDINIIRADTGQAAGIKQQQEKTKDNNPPEEKNSEPGGMNPLGLLGIGLLGVGGLLIFIALIAGVAFLVLRKK